MWDAGASAMTDTDATSDIVGNADPLASLRYAAFISYSHKDAELARWLHGSLEQFHVPQDLRSGAASGACRRSFATRPTSPVRPVSPTLLPRR